MLGELIEEAISAHPQLHLTGRVRTMRDAHESIPWADTQLASIDLHLPDGLGLSLAKRVRTSHPETRILMLSDHRRPTLLQSVDVRELGYWSYVLKSSIDSRAQLGDVLYRASSGGYIDPRIETGASDAESMIAALSDQQRRVLRPVPR